MAELVNEIAALRKLLAPHRIAGKTIGLVPTMGALHAGHRRLLEIARAETDIVVATIFVNPTQFNRPEDLDHYPRTLEQDLEVCREAGVDMVFAPSAAEMYPQEPRTWVDVPALAEHLCGPGRPGHFRGVATVVMKLFQIVQPDRAYFGEKDAQQLAIIRRMVKDLDVPVTVVPVATVREPDGLAMSSRNRHLTPEQRQRATVLSQALFAARDLVQIGERSAEKIRTAVAPLFDGIQLEYFSIVDPAALTPIECIDGPVLIAGAIWLRSTRLIDNLTVAP
jgi:pantoate--beta-alanine ligase